MQVHHKPVKILIGGKSGSGKTTYLIRYVRNSDYTRYFVFDHKNEFENRMGLSTAYSLEEVSEALKRGDRYISYHHSSEFPGDVETAFQVFCEWSYEVCKAMEGQKDGAAGNSLFVCDEVNRFTTTSDLGFGFKQLIEDGRLQGLDLVATSHAQNQISNRLRLQLSEIVALRTQDQRPLQFLEEEGFDVDKVRGLATGEYIVKDMNREIFTHGKLFSCNDGSNELEPENSDEQPEENKLDQQEESTPVENQNNALPSS